MSRSEDSNAPALKYGRAAAYGLGFALAGVVVWAAVAYLAHRNVAYLALAVGGLAGLGVYVATREPPEPESEGYSFRVRLPRSKSDGKTNDFREVRYGLLAAGVAVAAAAAGTLAATLATASPTRTAAATVAEEDMVRGFADDIVRERQSKGQKLTFPKNMKLSQPYYQDEYPAGVWSEAEGKWRQLPAAEQKAKLDERKKEVEKAVQGVQGAVQRPGVWDEVGPADLLLIVLAGAAAFGIAWVTNRPKKQGADDEE